MTTQILLAMCAHDVAWGGHVVDDREPLSEAEAFLAPSLRLGDRFELVEKGDARNILGRCKECVR